MDVKSPLPKQRKEEVDTGRWRRDIDDRRRRIERLIRMPAAAVVTPAAIVAPVTMVTIVAPVTLVPAAVLAPVAVVAERRPHG